MVDFLAPGDLTGLVPDGIDDATLGKMIEDATALAVMIAPCIAEEGFTSLPAVKAILRGVISRWALAGAGGVQSYTAGPFITSFDTRSDRRGVFWPSEIQQLQSLCASNTGSGTTPLAPQRISEREWTGPDQWRPVR